MSIAPAPLVRIVLTYGCFDGLSQSEIAFLRAAARLGDVLIVGCTSDELAVTRGTPCTLPFARRRAVLEKCRFVSHVIPENALLQQRTDIVNYNAGVLVVTQNERAALADLQDIVQIKALPLDVQRRPAVPHAGIAAGA
ncbi:MAG: glycerol-3-phosphate cytidylyltransferase [Pseudomonadota bacterium]